MIPLDDDGLARLLRETGARSPAPPERAARVEAALRPQWRGLVARRRRARTARWTALAASILAASLWIALRREAAGPPLATIERGSASGVTAALAEGARLETRAGERVALRAGSHSIRLDGGTRVTLVSRGTLALEQGAVYVDSGPSPSDVRLRVRTPFGAIEEMGTQFEARLREDGLEVWVREGRVSVERPEGAVRIEAGRAIIVDHVGSRELAETPPFDARWSWVQETAARPAIDGRTLADFLGWYGRESGLVVRFDDAAGGTILRGSIEGMSLDEALRSVLAASGLRARRSGPELLVEE